jgi:polyhydroxybutyrate depolymerase
MKRVVAAVAGLTLLAVLAQPGSSQDRVPGEVIGDRIKQRMEKRRLERVPRLNGAARATDAGAGYESIYIKGQLRTFRRYTPNSVLVGGKKAPVVFVLHGGMGTADQVQAYLGVNALADREGFVAVYPQGDNNRWNDGRPAGVKGGKQTSNADDVSFLNGLADALAVEGIADPAKTYIVGVSNGGFMALALACADEAHFAGFGAVIASMPLAALATCKPSRAAPVVMINGTEDPLIRFDGKPGKLGISGNAPPADVATHFAALAGCSGVDEVGLPNADVRDGTTVTQRRWTGCKPGAGVEFYTVKGGGHQAPSTGKVSGLVMLDVFLGNRSHDIDTAETVWRFFKQTMR